jgi:hypothetical protein
VVRGGVALSANKVSSYLNNGHDVKNADRMLWNTAALHSRPTRPRFRKPSLYPAELRDRTEISSTYKSAPIPLTSFWHLSMPDRSYTMVADAYQVRFIA